MPLTSTHGLAELRGVKMPRKEEGCAFFSSALLEQTFSVEMTIAVRLSAVSQKTAFFKNPVTLLEKEKLSLAAYR